MKKLLFLSAIIIIAVFSSCEKKYELTNYAIQNDTNDTVSVILTLNKSHSVDYLFSGAVVNYISGIVGGAKDHNNPFDAETHLVYKGKEYAENSLTGNSIRHKDAYRYTKTLTSTKGSSNYYYFYITEEYILSLPEVPLTKY
ncbi:MAG: hypothetical protein LBV75_02460 [Paludibacter sp.]|jgi:hypothetical protein|nr:hypothetical protein [Paludibacter sp.]